MQLILVMRMTPVSLSGVNLHGLVTRVISNRLLRSAMNPGSGPVPSGWNLCPSPAHEASTEIDTPQNENFMQSSVTSEPSWSLFGLWLAGLRVVTPYLGPGSGVVNKGQMQASSWTLDIPSPDASVRRLAKATASVAEGLEQDLNRALGNKVALSFEAYSKIPCVSSTSMNEVSSCPGGTGTEPITVNVCGPASSAERQSTLVSIDVREPYIQASSISGEKLQTEPE